MRMITCLFLLIYRLYWLSPLPLRNFFRKSVIINVFITMSYLWQHKLNLKSSLLVIAVCEIRVPKCEMYNER